MTARVCLQFETGILASGCGSRAFSSRGPAGVGRKAFIFIFEISVAALLRCSYINKRPSAQRRAAYKLLHGFGLLKYLFYICRRWLPNGITRRQGEVADLSAIPLFVRMSSRPPRPRRLPRRLRPLWGFDSQYSVRILGMHFRPRLPERKPDRFKVVKFNRKFQL